MNTYVYVGGNPIGFVDPSGLDIAVITGGIRTGSINVFGHSASAIESYGMASFGNTTEFGSSALDYISSQSAFRAQMITIIPTSSSQDSKAIGFLSKAQKDVGFFDNCAVRTNQVLNSAGIPTRGVPFPGGLARDVAALPGVTNYFIPKGGDIPDSLSRALKGF